MYSSVIEIIIKTIRVGNHIFLRLSMKINYAGRIESLPSRFTVAKTGFATHQ